MNNYSNVLIPIASALIVVSLLIHFNPLPIRRFCYCLPQKQCECPPNYVIVTAIGVIIGIAVCFLGNTTANSNASILSF